MGKEREFPTLLMGFYPEQANLAKPRRGPETVINPSADRLASGRESRRCITVDCESCCLRRRSCTNNAFEVLACNCIGECPCPVGEHAGN